MEHDSACAFADGHAQIDIQSYPRNPNTRIALVLAGKIRVVMRMAVAVAVAVTMRVSCMSPRMSQDSLNLGSHLRLPLL